MLSVLLSNVNDKHKDSDSVILIHRNDGNVRLSVRLFFEHTEAC